MCHPDWREDCEFPYQQTCEDLGFGALGLVRAGGLRLAQHVRKKWKPEGCDPKFARIFPSNFDYMSRRK